MTAKNDVTGDSIRTKGYTKAYADGWEKIFGKKKKKQAKVKKKENVSGTNS